MLIFCLERKKARIDHCYVRLPIKLNERKIERKAQRIVRRLILFFFGVHIE